MGSSTNVTNTHYEIYFSSPIHAFYLSTCLVALLLRISPHRTQSYVHTSNLGKGKEKDFMHCLRSVACNVLIAIYLNICFSLFISFHLILNKEIRQKRYRLIIIPLLPSTHNSIFHACLKDALTYQPY
jgi:hypothetical protein